MKVIVKMKHETRHIDHVAEVQITVEDDNNHPLAWVYKDGVIRIVEKKHGN